MALDLASVRAKLARSEEHAKAVKDEMTAYLEGQPYSLSRQINTDATRHSFFFHIKTPVPMERWALMIGDCIHNMRSALDHLVYAIGIHESGQNLPPNWNRLMFPISDSPKNFNHALRNIKTLSAPIRAAIESVQPYNRVHPELPPLLSVLSSFDNSDKHQLLRLAFTTPVRAKLHFSGKGNPLFTPDEVSYFAEEGELKDGTEVAALIFMRPAPYVSLDRVDMVGQITMNHAPGPQGSYRTETNRLLFLLHSEVKTVLDIVIAVVK